MLQIARLFALLSPDIHVKYSSPPFHALTQGFLSKAQSSFPVEAGTGIATIYFSMYLMNTIFMNHMTCAQRNEITTVTPKALDTWVFKPLPCNHLTLASHFFLLCSRVAFKSSAILLSLVTSGHSSALMSQEIFPLYTFQPIALVFPSWNL